MKISAVALLALSTIQQADAFVVKPAVNHGTTASRETSFSLNALPTKVKKGEKVQTTPDAGGLVTAIVRKCEDRLHCVFREFVFALQLFMNSNS